MQPRSFQWLLTVLLALACQVKAAGDPQVVNGVDISKWRGFNLTDKYTLRSNGKYQEDDFKWIAEFGFNFVRLPTDYRCYTETNNWVQFREDMLRDYDQAIAFGDKHNIHVCLNLHRAPGFCINPPAEATDLWTDEKTLEVFAAHWAMFARRYKGIAPDRLSFNLLNEPTRTSRDNYLKVFCRAIEAIQQVDPNRLIVVDGKDVGKEAIPEFLKYKNVIQATRGYHPGTISHYKASWVKGSDKYPDPIWPQVRLWGMLFGPGKPELQSALTLQGNFPAGMEFLLKVNRLSQRAKIVAKTDGLVLFEKVCDPKTQPAEWKKTPEESQYTFHEPTRELWLKATLPAGAKTLTIENADGDWLRFNELAVRWPDGRRVTIPTDMSYGHRQGTNEITAEGRLLPPPGIRGDQTLVDYLKPWVAISGQGAPVFVGEWGSHNKTPHPVVLAWMKSWLELWKEHRFGWALWNFRGSFGIMDSGRSDVQYEDWHGHKLDREMLKLLQGYN